MYQFIPAEKKGAMGEKRLDSSKGSVVFSNGSFSVDMGISTFFKKCGLSLVNDKHQVEFLNRYIADHGLEDEMYGIYSRVRKRLDIDNFDPTLDNSVKGRRKFLQKELYLMLDMFNPDKIGEYLSKIGVKSLVLLKGEFDKDKELDQIQSEDQTYLYHELYGLLGIVIMTKAIAPIFGEASNKSRDMFMKQHETLSYINMINEHKVFSSFAMDRLIRYINKHIDTKVPVDTTQRMLIALNIKVTEDVLWELALANSMFKKFVVLPIYDEQPQTGNVASVVYTVIKGITKDKMSVAGTHSIKDSTRPGYGEDSGSVAESYTQTTDVSIGDCAEFNKFTEDPIRIYRDIGGTDETIISEFIRSTKTLYSNPVIPCNGSVRFASFIIHNNVIDCRAVELLEYNNVINVLVASAAYMYSIGEKEIANLILLKRREDNGELLDISKPSTPPEVDRTELNKHYIRSVTKSKRKKSIVGGQHAYTSIIATVVNDIDKLFMGDTHEYVLPKRFRPDSMKDNTMRLPHNLKVIMIRLLNISRTI